MRGVLVYNECPHIHLPFTKIDLNLSLRERVNRDCPVGKGRDTRCHALRLIEHKILKSWFLG